ncbi:PAS domain-containing sensor histidine kinase [Bacillus sp. AFS073361]|uniref:PAS domain-containing sensor histidine kinase n=1 Tax=Bacillus sp. AFS073361 TaxID=2033511 RepID=UPI000BF5D605|nr:PAS domain S-box protein [Bacillus sp. AFS073361]PFP25817.1 PAS domain-containing sensor histidine kinase [Bacillus sp. AFS073361]
MNKKRLILFYLITSIIWIFGSNYLIEKFIPSSIVNAVERIKEILYILVTGGFLYFFISKKEELSATKEDQKRLSTLINSMVDFVNFKDGQGRWIEANEFGLHLFQLENVDYRGKKDSELANYTDFYGDALRYCEISDEEAWNNRAITRIEEVLPVPDGSVKIFDTIKVPLFNSDGTRQGLVIIGRDITEKKEMALKLAESQQQYKSLFEYSPDIVYMMDLSGTVTNLNSQYDVITGFKREEMIGKNIINLLPKRYIRYLPEFISTVVEEIKPVLYEINIPHANGNRIILQCTSLPIIINGKIAGIIGYGSDVTKLRETEERLRRTEKLSIVGELSASVAHEIRNPLTSLKGFVQLLQIEDSKHDYYYQIMLDELNRINHIVGELLLLAKPQILKYTQAVLQKILKDVISLLSTEASLYNVQIESSFPENEILIECEPNQLKQLFINLIKNSIEASPKGGTVSIHLEQLEENKVVININDTGCGISKERLEKIGEPFYSSKEKGTGLGLTVSFKIVESHQGTIHFNSQKYQGTSVQISLPVKQYTHRLANEKI